MPYLYFNAFYRDYIGPGLSVSSIMILCGIVFCPLVFYGERDKAGFRKEFLRAIEGKSVEDKYILHDAEILKKIFQANFLMPPAPQEKRTLELMGELITKKEFLFPQLKDASEILGGRVSDISETVSVPSWGFFWLIFLLSALAIVSLASSISFVMVCVSRSESLLDWSWESAWSWACFLGMLPILLPCILLDYCMARPIARYRQRLLDKKVERLEREHRELAARQLEDRQRRERELAQQRSEEGDMLSLREDAMIDLFDDDFLRRENEEGVTLRGIFEEDDDDNEDDSVPAPNLALELEKKKKAAHDLIQNAKSRFEETKMAWRVFFLEKADERARFLEHEASLSRARLLEHGKHIVLEQRAHAHNENLLREWKSAVYEARKNSGDAYARELSLILGLEHVTAVEISGNILHVYTDTLVIKKDGKKYEIGIFVLKIYLPSCTVMGVYNLASTHLKGADYPYGSGGKYCFGNLKETINTALKKGEVAAAVEYIIESICTINDGDSRVQEWKEVPE